MLLISVGGLPGGFKVQGLAVRRVPLVKSSMASVFSKVLIQPSGSLITLEYKKQDGYADPYMKISSYLGAYQFLGMLAVHTSLKVFDDVGCGVAEQKNGLSYELASQTDWQERKRRRFRSFLLILCFSYIFCLLM